MANSRNPSTKIGNPVHQAYTQAASIRTPATIIQEESRVVSEYYKTFIDDIELESASQALNYQTERSVQKKAGHISYNRVAGYDSGLLKKEYKKKKVSAPKEFILG